MIPTITKAELELVITLSSRVYTMNSLLTNASADENLKLREIKGKLKEIAKYYAEKYNKDYGPFEVSVSSGNPLAIGGKRLNRVWSGIFKGGENKQYSAQISMVINPEETCLDIGFYFGRASGHSVTYEQRKELEAKLNQLGIELAEAVTNNAHLRERYDHLFDLGFHAYSNGGIKTPDNWLNDIRIHTKSSQIVIKVYSNQFGIIDNTTLDFYISEVMYLMTAFKSKALVGTIPIPPLTPEQRAKQAQRLAEIGYKGEIYALNFERHRLQEQGIITSNYPQHVAMISATFGYDILSIDENHREIFIEVKTTTRLSTDPYSRRFYISLNEYNKFTTEQTRFRLYRVCDIEGTPSLSSLDLNLVEKTPDGYVITY